jgi:DNA polymerase-3 subunit alpha
MIASGDTGGVFQLESAGMKGFMKQLKPTCLEDIVAGVALYRPGPMDYIPKYVEGKHHPETVTYATPALEPILKNTYGVIVYQEQVMQITQALAGFSMGEADVVRKGMAKKKAEILAEEKEKFLYGTDKFVGCINNGVPEDVAKPLWADMEQFGKYAFNKSHAVAYAAIAMQTAYLKCHHSKEFYAGLLTSVMDKTSSLAIYIRESKERGVVIDPPNINTSDVNFSVAPDGHLRYGLASIKSLGKDAIEDALQEREMGDYTSLYDFMDRNRGINSAAITNLIYAGAFDFTGYNRASLAASVKPFQNDIKNKTNKIVKGQLSLFDMDMIEGNGEPDIIEIPEMPRIDKLMAEKEASGLFISEHPLENSTYKDISYTPLIDIVGTEEEPSHFKKWDNVTVHGIITELNIRYDKNGNKMCFLDLEDDCATVSVAVFSSTYNKYHDFDKKDIVTIVGKISDRNETLSVNADQIFKETALDKAIYVRLEDGKRPEDFKTSVQSIMRKAYERTSNRQVLFPVWINATKEQKQVLGLTTRQFLAGYTNNFSETIGILEEYLGDENIKIGIRGYEKPKAQKKKQQEIER